uniref:Protein C10 n=1 Tax=Pycnococcus provasolii TaxID=41880 RepID=A0A6U0C4H7_9CHLO|mmetsp:Transcript_4211/g.9517  ORF Transcript_4211/g.9517 Transcript_4211/m.9517 type:complete len:141 (+) Transcript_4211:64-486(+)
MASAFPAAPGGLAPPPMPTLTKENALSALKEVNEVCNANAQKLETAKAMSMGADGKPDVMKVMMVGMPIALDLAKDILAKYGFPADQGGLLAFFAACKAHDTDDEIKELAKVMRDAFLPPEVAAMLTMMMGGMGGAPPMP